MKHPHSFPIPFQRASDAPKLPHQPFRFVLHFLRHYRWALAAMLLLELGQAVCQILVPYAFRGIIDGVQQAGDGTGTPGATLESALWFFAAISLGILVFSRASGSLLVIIGPALRKRVRATVYRYLQYHSQRYFMGNFAGSLANRISEVSMSVNHSLWTVLFDFWPVTITFTASMVLFYQAEPGLALFLGAWIAAFVTVSWILAKRCRVYARDFAEMRSTVTGKIVDAVTNVLNTKLFARLDFERRHLDDYLELEVGRARKTFWFMEKMRWFQFTATLVLQIVMILLALRYWREGRITAGQFTMAASLAMMIIAEARNLSRRFLEFFEYLGNITEGVGVIVRPHDVIDPPGARPLEVGPGEIRFEGVSFSYSADGVNPVFRDLDVTIRPGERVGLVGFSGSGKSTFVNLLLRFFDVQGGRILVDGQNIAGVTQDSLRAQVSMIPQDPMLFHRSLMENIRYGRIDATDDEVIEAARRARADDFITAQREGYRTLVGERGIKLSGGQRQRIAIARAILKDAPILLMDEATSSLDSVTERAIQAGLEELMRGRTVVVIAHRLSTIAHLDRILVFDGGQIVEDGSHAELLAREDGHYARLWNMQAGGFLPEKEESLPPGEPVETNPAMA